MKLALATNNQHKIQEMRAILGDSFDELLSLKELGIDVDVEETGETLAENALLKAREITRLSGLPSLADDTGLMVDALNGAPGVYSARYAGEGHDDKANRELLLKNLSTATDRSAHFGTVIAVCYPDGKYLLAEGRVEGKIGFEERGNGGFGYDSLFISDELGKTFAEATQEEKNSVSHRGRALRAMLKKLQEEC
ncbi:MAG: RdgB/HAM1 family non-canonical purine NTP pyrophosphatase [Clostridia bacterium]|nr:RdgB/HAM1 family non-canonical purine NTP pyrophosphatase [Clostridia bacterium]